jgi:hypothetical protein
MKENRKTTQSRERGARHIMRMGSSSDAASMGAAAALELEFGVFLLAPAPFSHALERLEAGAASAGSQLCGTFSTAKIAQAWLLSYALSSSAAAARELDLDGVAVDLGAAGQVAGVVVVLSEQLRNLSLEEKPMRARRVTRQ